MALDIPTQVLELVWVMSLWDVVQNFGEILHLYFSKDCFPPFIYL